MDADFWTSAGITVVGAIVAFLLRRAISSVDAELTMLKSKVEASKESNHSLELRLLAKIEEHAKESRLAMAAMRTDNSAEFRRIHDKIEAARHEINNNLALILKKVG